MSLFQAITASLDSVIDIPTLVLALSQPVDFTGIRCFHFWNAINPSLILVVMLSPNSET